MHAPQITLPRLLTRIAPYNYSTRYVNKVSPFPYHKVSLKHHCSTWCIERVVVGHETCRKQFSATLHVIDRSKKSRNMMIIADYSGFLENTYSCFEDSL